MSNTSHINRNSSIELLRILCIIGIVYMHVSGIIYSTVKGINQVMGVFTNTLFNVGVSCFFLISGYFGIKANRKKLISLHGLILFYSITGFWVVSICFHQFIFKDFVKSVLPIVSKKYWFLTCYFILFVFSSYIDMAVIRLGKHKMEKLLLILLFMFSFIPTFLYFEVTGDNGKGIINATIMYLIGRCVLVSTTM
ncbi:MAG: acyltransferase family protein [Lachnospiraceae bacterium]|nr:acyltransferase family protein [Lachnospiraceae bacterium]